MRKNKQAIQYEDLLKKEQQIKNLEALGFEKVIKRSKALFIIGSALSVFGYVTLPLPTGSLIFIGVGNIIILKSGYDLITYKKNLKKRIANKLRSIKIKLFY